MDSQNRQQLAALCRIEIRRWQSVSDKQYMVDLLELALAALTVDPVKVPDGWRLVPIEPTEEMLTTCYSVTGVYSKSAYQVMIGASPKPEDKC